MNGTKYIANLLTNCDILQILFYISLTIISPANSLLNVFVPEHICYCIVLYGWKISIKEGQQIHNELQRNAIDVHIKNTSIGFYGNWSNVTKAWNIFDFMSEDVKYLLLTKAYNNNNVHEECVKLYHQINDVIVKSHSTPMQFCGYINNAAYALDRFVTINLMMQCILYSKIGQGNFKHIAKNGMLWMCFIQLMNAKKIFQLLM